MTAENTALRQLRSVLAMNARLNTGSKWWLALATLWGVLFVVIVFIFGIVFWIRVPTNEWANLARIPALGLLASAVILLSMALVGVSMGFALQFKPTHTALVPHLRQRLPQGAAIFCVAIAIVAAILVAAFLPDHRPLLAGLSAMGIALGLVIGARSASMVAVFFAVGFAAFTDDPLVQPFTHPVKDFLAVLPIGLTAGLAVLLSAVYWTFALRGDKHLALSTNQSSLQWATASSGKAAPPMAYATSFAFHHYLAWRLRRSAALGNSGGHAGRAHFLVALGPGFHWVTALSFILLFDLGAGALLLAMQTLLDPESWAFWSTMVALQLAAFQAFMVLLFLDQARWVMHQTRAEQGLLALAEHAPSLATQSDRLLPYLLRQYLVVWTFSTLVIAGFGIWTQSAALEISLVACAAFALLPCTAFMIRRYAIDDNAELLTSLKKGLIPMFAITTAMMFIGILVHTFFPVAWILGLIALTAALWYWRINSVRQHGGLMLPAGRAG